MKPEEIARWDKWFATDEQASREWNAAKNIGSNLWTWVKIIELNRIDRAMKAKEPDNASIQS